MQVEVISLGGSLVVPDAINVSYLRKLRTLLHSFSDRKFVLVIGGGKTARTYIHGLPEPEFTQRQQAMAGIRVTRLNAWYLATFFGASASHTVPTTVRQVKTLLHKNKIVLVGGLRFQEEQTSDGTAASLARHFRTRFINLTNVQGLFTKDPRKHKDAQFIPSISFADFATMIRKLEYRPGQHFVLDHHAAKIIQSHKIPTYIVGSDLANLKRLLQGYSFVGTSIGTL